MIKRKIKRWLIPQGWIDLIQRLTPIIEKSIQEESIVKPKYEIDSLIALKGKHAGERCFILASGPSINKQDLTLLKDETTIAVSQFFLHPQIDVIRPKYHCFAPQHEPFNDETNKIIFDNYIGNYKFPVKSFIGSTEFKYSYYNYLNKHPEYKIDASFIDYSSSSQLNESNYLLDDSWDITQNPFSLRTVIYIAIQVAYYLGFKEIYLLGVDHDYLNDINRTDHHFYKENKSFSDKEHLEMFTMERWFEEYYYRWKQYRLMNEFLSTKGISIFNATDGGLLDVFPRVNYSDLFGNYNVSINEKTN